MQFRHSQFRPITPEEREKLLRAAVTRAAEQNIPRGCHHQNTHYLPAEIREMIEKRDTATDTATASQRNAEIKKENPQPQENKMEGIRGEHAPIDRENLASCQQGQRQENSTEKDPAHISRKSVGWSFGIPNFGRPPPRRTRETPSSGGYGSRWIELSQRPP